MITLKKLYKNALAWICINFKLFNRFSTKKPKLETKKQWDNYVAVQLINKDMQHHSLYVAMLDNLWKYFNQQGVSIPDSDIFPRSVAIKLVIKILDNLIPGVFNTVGVQPMKGPVGLTYSMQYAKPSEDDNRLTLKIISNAVEAMSSKLKAGWSIEPVQDLATIHGIDLEAEIVETLAQEIAYEITDMLLRELKQHAGKLPKLEFDLENISDSNTLTTTITAVTNQIAQEARRGPGNFVVTTPMGLDMLHTCLGGTLKKSSDVVLHGAGMGHAGTIVCGEQPQQRQIEVYVCLHETEKDYLLFGYKGQDKIDAGMFYCPYQLVISYGVDKDPKTFAPVLSFMTRYGLQIATKTKNTFCDASNYYKYIPLEIKQR